jgi:hypothetical protein
LNAPDRVDQAAAQLREALRLQPSLEEARRLLDLLQGSRP